MGRRCGGAGRQCRRTHKRIMDIIKTELIEIRDAEDRNALEDAIARFARYDWIEQVARGAGLTLPGSLKPRAQSDRHHRRKKPRMSLFLRRLALLGAAVVAFLGGRAMRTAVHHMAVGRLPL